MLLTVLIVNYNGAKYLEAAINSVLSQRCTDVELLVVDGNSKDESVDIIENMIIRSIGGFQNQTEAKVMLLIKDFLMQMESI